MAKLLVEEKVPCLFTDYSAEAVRAPAVPSTPCYPGIILRDGVAAGAARAGRALRGRDAERPDAAGADP